MLANIVRTLFNRMFHYNFIPNCRLVNIVIYIDQSNLRFFLVRYLFISRLPNFYWSKIYDSVANIPWINDREDF